MTGKFKRTAAALALVASCSMAATPAMARGWGDRWGGHRHHDRVDGGDILAGILIIGGIAAIASAASKSNKQRQDQQRDNRQVEPNYRDDGRDYGNDDSRPEWRDAGGIDNAINRCIDEVNRGRTRVGEVDSVNRDADGWRIAGTTTGSGNFTCTIDRDGRIRNVNVDGQTF